MFLRRVSREKIPGCSSDQAEESARPEGPAPAVVNHKVGDETGRNAGTHSDAGKYDAVRDATLLGGNPSRYKLIGGGKHYGFAGPKQESHCRQVKNCECDFRSSLPGGNAIHAWGRRSRNVSRL